MARLVEVLNRSRSRAIIGATQIAGLAIATVDIENAEVLDDLGRYSDVHVLPPNVAIPESTYIGHDVDNNQGPVNLVAAWTAITALQLQVDGGDGTKDVEVDLFIPTFQGAPTPNVASINYYVALVDTEVGPNETIMQAEFDHDGDNHPLKRDMHIRAIIPAFVGTKTIVPKAWSNTNMTVQVGGTGETAGHASLSAKFLA